MWINLSNLFFMITKTSSYYTTVFLYLDKLLFESFFFLLEEEHKIAIFID